jgi:hypothetical protein
LRELRFLLQRWQIDVPEVHGLGARLGRLRRQIGRRRHGQIDVAEVDRRAARSLRRRKIVMFREERQIRDPLGPLRRG